MSKFRYLTAKSWPAPEKGRCRYCGGPVARGRRTTCGEACAERARLLMFPHITAGRVWKRDGGKCVKCGEAGDAVDHIIPVSEGGGVRPDMSVAELLGNLRVLCRRCHAAESAALRVIQNARRRQCQKFNGTVAIATKCDFSPSPA